MTQTSAKDAPTKTTHGLWPSAVREKAAIWVLSPISAKKIAESLGGGGHERAAGFRMNGNCSPNEIYDVISGKIMEFYP